MNRRIIQVLVIATVLAVLSIGWRRKPDPLKDYVKQYKYTAFNPPRDRDGVGTIIDFKNRTESVVADDTQCLTNEAAPRGPNIEVATLNQEYTLTRNSSLDFNLAKGYIKEADLAGAFKDNRVKAVSIQLIEPYESRLTKYTVAQYLSKLKPGDPCRQYMADPKNFVIERTLAAKGVRYAFKNSSNQNINLDATLLNAIGLKGGTASNFVGASTLQWDKPLLIGYRLWKVREASAVAGSQLTIREMDSRDVAKARDAS